MTRAIVVLLLTAACGTGATYRTTRIAPVGSTEWIFGAQASGMGVRRNQQMGDNMGSAPLPELAVGARRGVVERVEVQINGTMLPTAVGQTASLELGGKALLYEHGRWSLAAGAATGYRIAHVGGAIIEDVYVTVPVIGGVKLGRHELVLSIDGGYHRAYSSGAKPVGIPFIGESIGFRWQLTRRWALLPEVGTAVTPTENFRTEDSRLFHAGIAVLWSRY